MDGSAAEDVFFSLNISCGEIPLIILLLLLRTSQSPPFPPPIKAGLKLRAFSMKERGGGKCKKRIEKSPPPSLPWPPMHHSPFHCELPLQAKLRTSFAPDASRFTVCSGESECKANSPYLFLFSSARNGSGGGLRASCKSCKEEPGKVKLDSEVKRKANSQKFKWGFGMTVLVVFFPLKVSLDAIGGAHLDAHSTVRPRIH